MSVLRTLATPLLGLVALVAGCNGYAELNLPVRGTADATVESQDLYPGRLGTVQLLIALPEGTSASSPLFVVGAPDILAANANEVSWAYGPCRHGGDPPADPGPDALRICVAVNMQSGQGMNAPFTIFTVLEDRATQQRFDVVAEVTP